MTQIPYQQIYRTFMGYVSRGAKYSGLLEKCPALATHDQTTTAAGEDGGSSIRRKVTAFTFNREIYSSWSKGGLVWLRPDDGDGGDGSDPGPTRFQHFQQVLKNKAGKIRRLTAEKKKDLLFLKIGIPRFQQIEKNGEAHPIRVPAFSLSCFRVC